MCDRCSINTSSCIIPSPDRATSVLLSKAAAPRLQRFQRLQERDAYIRNFHYKLVHNLGGQGRTEATCFLSGWRSFGIAEVPMPRMRCRWVRAGGGDYETSG